MSSDLWCASWPIQLREPETSDNATRIQIQEEYLRRYLGPWIEQSTGTLFRDLHSFHFMRYLDATHLKPVLGIIIEVRILASRSLLTQNAPIVQAELERQLKAGIIARFERKPDGNWRETVIAEYGGPDVAEPFAHFLSVSSRLTLDLLKRQVSFQTREMVFEQWAHCFRLITSGTG